MPGLRPFMYEKSAAPPSESASPFGSSTSCWRREGKRTLATSSTARSALPFSWPAAIASGLALASSMRSDRKKDACETAGSTEPGRSRVVGSSVASAVGGVLAAELRCEGGVSAEPRSAAEPRCTAGAGELAGTTRTPPAADACLLFLVFGGCKGRGGSEGTRQRVVWEGWRRRSARRREQTLENVEVGDDGEGALARQGGVGHAHGLPQRSGCLKELLREYELVGSEGDLLQVRLVGLTLWRSGERAFHTPSSQKDFGDGAHAGLAYKLSTKLYKDLPSSASAARVAFCVSTRTRTSEVSSGISSIGRAPSPCAAVPGVAAQAREGGWEDRSCRHLQTPGGWVALEGRSRERWGRGT